MHNTLLVSIMLVILLAYWLVFRTSRSRIVFISIASIGLIGTVVPKAVIGVIVLTVAVFNTGRYIRRNPGSLNFCMAIALPLSVLLFFKYLVPLLRSENFFPFLGIPVGVSYYTFKNIHYLIECSRGKFEDAKFIEYLAYIFFFPMFLAGPIERFPSFLSESRNASFSWANISSGCERILVGLIRKFVIADLLLDAFLFDPFHVGLIEPEIIWYQMWFAGFAMFLKLYFDFGGYTDIVLGVSLLFGIRLGENFNFPLLRPNLAEFWRNWHISLSSWARDYVYFPLLGRYRLTNLALIATMLTIGIWHSLALDRIFWGLHHGTGLIMLSYFHRWARTKPRIQSIRATSIWRVCATLFTIAYVSLGYILTYFKDDPFLGFRLYLRILTLGLAS